MILFLTQLKSYAELREPELTSMSQGYCAYKESTSSDDYFLYNPERSYRYYVFFLGVSLISLVTMTAMLIPAAVLKQYKTLHDLATEPRTDNQHFRFRNLLCGFISVLAFFVLGVTVYGIHHTVTFGLHWKTEHSFIYPMIITGALLFPCLGAVAAFFIVKWANDSNLLIPIPRLLYGLTGILHPTETPPIGYHQKVVLLIWQGIGVWVVMLSAVSASFFLCGILLGFFVDPIQVISTLGVYASVALGVALTFARVFEKTDAINEQRNSKKPIFVAYTKFIFECVIFALALVFVGIFGYTYITIVFFTSGKDNFGLFSSFGELLPFVLVSVITWTLRNELTKYKARREELTATQAVQLQSKQKFSHYDVNNL